MSLGAPHRPFMGRNVGNMVVSAPEPIKCCIPEPIKCCIAKTKINGLH